MEIKAAIEKNVSFCYALTLWWADMLADEYPYDDIMRAHDLLNGAFMWAKSGSKEESELRFLRDLLLDQRGVYEIKEQREAA